MLLLHWVENWISDVNCSSLGYIETLDFMERCRLEVESAPCTKCLHQPPFRALLWTKAPLFDAIST